VAANVAATAALFVAGGAVVMLVALAAAPGSWLLGYVSEAGTAGQPYAIPYRWGLVLLALGVASLTVTYLLRPPSVGCSRLIAALLGLAAVLAGVSGAVPCSSQCPLPPFEPTTVADVVHTAASIVGMVSLAGAMLASALADPRPIQRRLSAVAVALTVPLGGALGLTMLLVGRGTLGATLERALLVVAVGWLIGTSGFAGRQDAVRQRRAARRLRSPCEPGWRSRG
jgi:hypothetical protein